MFLLKKFISFWVMPLPFCLTLLVAGLGLTLSTRRAGLGKMLLCAGVLLLVLFSNRAVSTWLIRPLEFAYPPVPELSAAEPLPLALAACRAVVVLGGGHVDTPGLSAINQLSSASRGRLMEAIRILRLLPEARLVLNGRGGPMQQSHAAVMAAAAVSLGVDPSRIVRLETSRDTEEEAAAVRTAIGSEPFALVTSASHMRRACALMRGQGLTPVPCPSDHTTRHPEKTTLADYAWDTESLGRSTWAVYERIGYAWAWLRGKTG